MAASDWETGSGLVLDGGTATISDAEFTYNTKLGPNPVLKLTLTDVSDSDGNTTGEDVEQSFSCGKSLEPNKDGSELVGSARINKQTNLGILIDSAKALFDDVDDLVAILPNPKDAKAWVGTRWTFGTISLERLNPSTGETKVATPWVFTESHGRVESGKAAAAPKKAAKAAPAAEAAADDGDGGLFAQLVTLAGTFDDHGDFVDAALEVPGVDEDRDIQKAIVTTKAGSVWAAAKG